MTSNISDKKCPYLIIPYLGFLFAILIIPITMIEVKTDITSWILITSLSILLYSSIAIVITLCLLVLSLLLSRFVSISAEKFNRYLIGLSLVVTIFLAVVLFSYSTTIIATSTLRKILIFAPLGLVIIIFVVKGRALLNNFTARRNNRWFLLRLSLLYVFNIIIVASLGEFDFSGVDQVAGSDSKPNVILVSIDALRADHLGCYGYQLPCSPYIDSIALEGARFENAMCPIPSSTPSHASLLTGLTPLTHGARMNGYALSPEIKTLAEYLKDSGYNTAGFVTNIWISSSFGIDQGFDLYMESGRLEVISSRDIYYLARAILPIQIFDKYFSKSSTLKVSTRWLRSAQAPFFAFIHFLDVHAPYIPPDEYLRMFLDDKQMEPEGKKRRRIRMKIAKYDGEIKFVDDMIRELDSLIKSNGLSRRTILIILSDHGENLRYHPPLFTHVGLYDSSLQIPVIFRYPGVIRPDTRIKSQIENIDILPTILSLVGVEVPRYIQGRDLSPLLTENGTMDSLTGVGYASVPTGECVRSPDWKYILRPDGNSELFDLIADPAETLNVIETHPEVAAHYHDLLIEKRISIGGTIGPTINRRSEISREARQRLKKLGYLVD